MAFNWLPLGGGEAGAKFDKRIPFPCIWHTGEDALRYQNSQNSILKTFRINDNKVKKYLI